MAGAVDTTALLRLALIGVTALLVTLALGPGDSRADAAAPRTVTVAMGDFSYTPGTVTIKPGDRVKFVNRGKIDHTVADVDAKGEILGKAIKPKLLARGESQVVTFAKAGRISYFCTLHPTLMKGTVVVRP
ncbi:MAG: amicyanin [Actinobacteria bacterium]|nr:amicyanin [Actinomycetota bacterium]